MWLAAPREFTMGARVHIKIGCIHVIIFIMILYISFISRSFWHSFHSCCVNSFLIRRVALTVDRLCSHGCNKISGIFPPQNRPPTDTGSFPSQRLRQFLLVLVLVLFIVFLYWKSKQFADGGRFCLDKLQKSKVPSPLLCAVLVVRIRILALSCILIQICYVAGSSSRVHIGGQKTYQDWMHSCYSLYFMILSFCDTASILGVWIQFLLGVLTCMCSCLDSR